MRGLAAGLFGRGLLPGIALSLLLTSPAHGQSAFSREGLGDWLEGYDLAGQGRGSTGIGVIEPYNFGGVNPASHAFTRLALGYVGLQGSVNWTEDGSETARQAAGLISGVAGRFSPARDLAVRLGVRPRSDATYVIEEAIDTGSGSTGGNRHRDEGSRGLLYYTADLAWRGGRAWAVGFGAGLHTGSILDENFYDFSDSGWTSTQDRRVLRFKPAWTLSAGFQWSPWERLALGGVYAHCTPIEIDETFTSTGETDWTRKTELDATTGVGAGVSLFISPHLRLSGDLFWRDWDAVRLRDGSLPQAGAYAFRNTTRWGVGIERTPRMGPATTFWDHLALRAGFAWMPWYVQTRAAQATGSAVNGVDEHRITAGLGVPIRGDRGRIDLLCCWGSRGSLNDNGLAERYLRFGFACTFASTLREY